MGQEVTKLDSDAVCDLVFANAAAFADSAPSVNDRDTARDGEYCLTFQGAAMGQQMKKDKQPFLSLIHI